MVSVIIPVYNVEKYLDRCLESVVSQTCPDIEIILINDGSTDSSGKLCKKWADKDNRIRLFDTENRGLGPARNLGISKAKADYLIFLDSDDWWEPNTVEELWQAAKKNDADLVYMNFFYSEMKPDGSFSEREYSEHCSFDAVSCADAYPELVFPSNMRMWSKLFKKSLFIDNDLYMPAHPFEDFPVMPLLILHAKRICQIHKPLYHYFINRTGNLTGDVRNNRYIPIGLEELYLSLEKHGFFPKYKEAYEDYVFQFCKRTLGDSRYKDLDEEEATEYRNDFIKLLEKYCKEKLAVIDKRFYILGSNSNYIVCLDAIFEHQVIGCNIYTNSRKNISKNLENDKSFDSRINNADYIVVDFLQYVNGNSIDLTVEQICGDMEQRLSALGDNQKVIVLKLLLAEMHGVDADNLAPYNELDVIRESNKKLSKCYEKIIENLGEKATLVELSQSYNYTYENTAMGCLPIYYNWRFHKAASELFLKVVKSMA